MLWIENCKSLTTPNTNGARILHYIDVIMTTMASQVTSLTVVYSTVYSDADQRKHQSSASLAFVWGIHRDRWIPRTKGQLRGKCFHLMTSSCMRRGNVCSGCSVFVLMHLGTCHLDSSRCFRRIWSDGATTLLLQCIIFIVVLIGFYAACIIVCNVYYLYAYAHMYIHFDFKIPTDFNIL